MEASSLRSSGHTTRSIGGKEYWTSAKAAEYLGLSKGSLLTYARAGKISCLKHGTITFYQKEWLDAYLDEKTNIGKATKKKD